MTTPEESTIDRIRKLLAMAEGGATEAERDAFNAKATELMFKHAIEEAMITDIGRAISEEIVKVEHVTTCPKSYSHEYALIAIRVADAMGARGLLRRGYDNRENYTLVGYASDLDAIKQLIDSLMRQCTFALGPWYRSNVRGWHSGTDKFNMKRGFITGFASGVRDKILATKNRTIAKAGTGSAVAVVDREQRVTSWLDEHMKLGTSKGRNYSSSAAAGGWGAGQRADIGSPSVGGVRKAIGG